MKYFCTPEERNGTCYCEFQRGGFNENFWLEDSLLIHDDVWYDTGLEDFFFEVLPDLEMYGTAEIGPDQWSSIMSSADEYDDTVTEALEELDEWVQETFEINDVFTILGL